MNTLTILIFVVSAKITIIETFEFHDELDKDLKCNATEHTKTGNDYKDCKQESARLYAEMNKEAKLEKPISEIQNKTKGYVLM